mmetsp:Transcript_64764/g.169573  ORF Transcript_64764/g.169573 Transcript_64764/m.169573 type:complete len:307 (+) Transcript_64764:410-1330(+)
MGTEGWRRTVSRTQALQYCIRLSVANENVSSSPSDGASPRCRAASSATSSRTLASTSGLLCRRQKSQERVHAVVSRPAMMKFITMSRRNFLSSEPSMKRESRSEQAPSRAGRPDGEAAGLREGESLSATGPERFCRRRSSRISSTTLSMNSRLSISPTSSLRFHMRPSLAKRHSTFHHGLSQNLLLMQACAVSKCRANARRSPTLGAESSRVFQGRPKPISQKASRVSEKNNSCISISWPGGRRLITETKRRACTWNISTMFSLKFFRLKIVAATLRWCFQCSPSVQKMPWPKKLPINSRISWPFP